MNDQAYNVSADELRQFVERIEAKDEYIASENEARKEIYSEAKGRGYDAKVLRKVIALRKRKPDEIAEEEAVIDMYRTALGMV